MKKSPFALLILVLVVGCGDEEIRTYTVPRVEAPHIPPSEPSDTILAAILPGGGKTWYFKLAGPVAMVRPVRPVFEKFIASVHFHDAKIDYTVPPAWKPLSATGMRHASFSVSGMELSVIALAMESGSILDNVNRWLGQIRRPAITAQQLPRVTRKVGETTFVYLEPEREVPAALAFDTPEGWKDTGARGMRAASFSMKDAEVTVIPLGPEAGDLLSNVNRWLGQVGLENVDQAGLDALRKDVTIAGEAADFVDLAGAEKRMLAAVLKHGGKTWFFKMMGSTEAVEREKENFDAFLASIRFSNG